VVKTFGGTRCEVDEEHQRNQHANPEQNSFADHCASLRLFPGFRNGSFEPMAETGGKRTLALIV
jgi:hypothetical protein